MTLWQREKPCSYWVSNPSNWGWSKSLEWLILWFKSSLTSWCLHRCTWRWYSPHLHWTLPVKYLTAPFVWSYLIRFLRKEKNH